MKIDFNTIYHVQEERNIVLQKITALPSVMPSRMAPEVVAKVAKKQLK